MTSQGDIGDFIERARRRLAEAGPERLAGQDLSDRLRALVAEIDATVLPRNLIYALQDGLSCTLTVASRRLMRISVSSPEGHQVIEAEPGTGREEELLVMAEALAGLAAIEEPLILVRHALAEEMAADDVGQAVGDLQAFCAAHDWFAVPPDAAGEAGAEAPMAAASGAVHWCEIDAQGVVLATGGTPDLTGDALVALARERAGWPRDLGQLAGDDCVVLVQGDGARAVALHLAEGRTRVTVGDGLSIDAMLAVARDGGAK